MALPNGPDKLFPREAYSVEMARNLAKGNLIANCIHTLRGVQLALGISGRLQMAYASDTIEKAARILAMDSENFRKNHFGR